MKSNGFYLCLDAGMILRDEVPMSEETPTVEDLNYIHSD